MGKFKQRKPFVRGEVIEALPDLKFNVKLEDGQIARICYLSGKMRINKINVQLHDWVEIEALPPDLKNGRIVRRS